MKKQVSAKALTGFASDTPHSGSRRLRGVIQAIFKGAEMKKTPAHHLAPH